MPTQILQWLHRTVEQPFAATFVFSGHPVPSCRAYWGLLGLRNVWGDQVHEATWWWLGWMLTVTTTLFLGCGVVVWVHETTSVLYYIRRARYRAILIARRLKLFHKICWLRNLVSHFVVRRSIMTL